MDEPGKNACSSIVPRILSRVARTPRWCSGSLAAYEIYVYVVSSNELLTLRVVDFSFFFFFFLKIVLHVCKNRA